MPSTAKVAMPAARPDRRMSGRPTTKANTPPSPAASSSDTTFPTEWSARNGNRSGSTFCFTPVSSDMIPAQNAPTATKLMCPKESTPELPTNTYRPTTMATFTSAVRK